MPATYYPAVIDRSSTGYGVSFPDFPGCIASGTTPNEAALNAEAAIALHIETMAKDGDTFPAPSSLEDIQPVDRAEDIARILIRVDTPAKVNRVLVSLDENLLRAIDAVASNRSAWIADAARARLASGR
ncbi:type II toxin-antitoxin system HicB family antitoxin [Rhizorhabdus sp.]|uniref:type II toxin-antitoxin system HicB family antitoxin n=1 Tax=Rhizorhabdus sp. TaxID=1968843 RepID=UPI0035B1422D